jgi:hypothetical protein
MIIEKLNEHYAALPRDPFRIRPSGIGGCLREMAFRLAGEEAEPLRPEQARAFELGTQRGEALERAAKAVWPSAETQVAVKIPVGRFVLDGTLDLWLPEERTVVDFKTQATFGFALLYSEGVSPEYMLQIHAYRHGIAIHKGLPVQDIRALLVYEAKDSDGRKSIRAQDLKEVEVPFTDELERRYQARVKELALLMEMQAQRKLEPGVIGGLQKTNGKVPWKCREENGKALYCSIGPTRGKCFG